MPLDENSMVRITVVFSMQVAGMFCTDRSSFIYDLEHDMFLIKILNIMCLDIHHLTSCKIIKKKIAVSQG